MSFINALLDISGDFQRITNEHRWSCEVNDWWSCRILCDRSTFTNTVVVILTNSHCSHEQSFLFPKTNATVKSDKWFYHTLYMITKCDNFLPRNCSMDMKKISIWILLFDSRFFMETLLNISFEKNCSKCLRRKVHRAVTFRNCNNNIWQRTGEALYPEILWNYPW